MSETIDKTILELMTSVEGIEDIFKMNNFETKCECCGYVLSNTEQDGPFFRYVTCPNCSYIQYVPNWKKVPPFCIYKIVAKPQLW